MGNNKHDFLLEFRIVQNTITCINTRSIVSDNINSVMCEFEFDDSWEGLYKIVTFKNSSTKVSRYGILGLENASTYVPWEILASNG